MADDEGYHASPRCRERYHELTAYTLSLGDPDFVHQHVVDAYAAQHSGPAVDGRRTGLALIGLYLYLERGFSGRSVQQAHTRLARRSGPWPPVSVTAPITGLTVDDILATPPGPRRPSLVHEWAVVVWRAWEDRRPDVTVLTRLSWRRAPG